MNLYLLTHSNLSKYGRFIYTFYKKNIKAVGVGKSTKTTNIKLIDHCGIHKGTQMFSNFFV